MIRRLFATTAKYKEIIKITDNAWDKMAQIIKTKDAIGFIFSATSGGCNGFNYNLKLLDESGHEKLYKDGNKIKPTIIEKNKIKLFIDPFTEMFLLGTTINYISEDYEKGIFENKFVFTPDKKIASSCGCGISFTPKQ